MRGTVTGYGDAGGQQSGPLVAAYPHLLRQVGVRCRRVGLVRLVGGLVHGAKATDAVVRPLGSFEECTTATPGVDGPELYEPPADPSAAWPRRTASGWMVGRTLAEASARPPGARMSASAPPAGTRTLVAWDAAHEPSTWPTKPDAAPPAALPQASVHVGDAESIPLPDHSVDAVVALQAWHWFDSLAAGRECARVLAPGGTLGVAWHVRDERVPWVAELSDASGRREDPGADLRGVRDPDVGPSSGLSRWRSSTTRTC